MFKIREIIDDHFTIRVTNESLPDNETTAHEIIKRLRTKEPAIHNLLKRCSGVHLMGSYSLLKENEEILVLFPPIEDIEEIIEELKYASSNTNDPFVLEEIAFLVYCLNIAAGRDGDDMNEDFEDNDCIDTFDDDSISFDDIVDDVISLTTDQNNNLDTDFLHEVLDDKAPCERLSFETTSGHDMYWFYKKILNLKVSESVIHIYVKDGAYCIIILCDKLTAKQCVDIVLKANEAKLTMLDSLANVSLMEHGTRLNNDLITFAGENNISLKGRRIE